MHKGYFYFIFCYFYLVFYVFFYLCNAGGTLPPKCRKLVVLNGIYVQCTKTIGHKYRVYEKYTAVHIV
jgi:hypothetical protein